ncbi:MAG: reactive intermediate/imine deaminase [Tenericutes bacterium HGW-Tenericutes-5]|jgi:2-iminobutanoate/2-iminopropanoate deaminase|nr:MAG: reactive intermediate/imine deaminase [Tenericutes bacterium HGW-Tenericutes-7]PKK95398.1 MAG: reactive intermediate/imine deaminase [Tenericutes bacterium HGW-Tenericutes-5]
MKFIHSSHAPEAIGPYSQAVLVGDTLYVSGQTPINPLTKRVDGTEIKSQTLQCLQNILAIVEEAGMKKKNIVKCGVFLKNMSMFKEMNEVYNSFFGDHKPARVTVEVARLPLDALVEIDCTACK